MRDFPVSLIARYENTVLTIPFRNQGCGTAGFSAVEGWDPVTGLGTPDVAALEALWIGLP